MHKRLMIAAFAVLLLVGGTTQGLAAYSQPTASQIQQMVSLIRFLKARLAQDAAFSQLDREQRFQALLEAVKLFGVQPAAGIRFTADMSEAQLGSALLGGTSDKVRVDLVADIQNYLGTTQTAPVADYYAGARPAPRTYTAAAAPAPGADAATMALVARSKLKVDAAKAKLAKLKAEQAKINLETQKLIRQKQVVEECKIALANAQQMSPGKSAAHWDQFVRNYLRQRGVALK